MAVAQRQSGALQDGLDEVKAGGRQRQARKGCGQCGVVVRRSFAGQVGREHRRLGRGDAGRFHLVQNSTAHVSLSDEQGDPGQRRPRAQDAAVLEEEALHGVTVGVHAAA